MGTGRGQRLDDLPVVPEDVADEGRDPVATGVIGEHLEKEGAETPMLVIVEHRHRHLGVVGIGGVSDVAGDADTWLAGLVDRERRPCEVIVIVEIGEVLKIGVREP